MEYPHQFKIENIFVKALEYKIDENDVLSVLCEPIGENKFKCAKKHSARWFDVTTLPTEVCEWYYKYNPSPCGGKADTKTSKVFVSNDV